MKAPPSLKREVKSRAVRHAKQKEKELFHGKKELTKIEVLAALEDAYIKGALYGWRLEEKDS